MANAGAASVAPPRLAPRTTHETRLGGEGRLAATRCAVRVWALRSGERATRQAVPGGDSCLGGRRIAPPARPTAPGQLHASGHKRRAAQRDVCSLSEPRHRFRKGACGQAGARLGGAEKRRAWGGARSAHQQLTRGRCLSAVSAANAASPAPKPQARASQGKSALCADRRREAPRPARTRLCRRHACMCGELRRRA
jgi:hypothetical protein